MTVVYPLDIFFRTKKLQKQCSDDREAVKAFGRNRAKRIRQRLDDLHAAQNLDDMRSLPGRFHPLIGDRSGQFSLDLDGPYRLIFEAVVLEEGDAKDLDWSKVMAVRILGIEDTHE